MEKLQTPKVVYGGISTEIFHFKWVIGNFETIAKSPMLISKQEVFFTTSTDSVSTGLDLDEVGWKVRLQHNLQENWLKLCLALAPEDNPDRLAKLRGVGVQLVAADGSGSSQPGKEAESDIVDAQNLQHSLSGIRGICGIPELVIRIIPSNQLQALPLVNGALVIHVKLYLYSQKVPQNCTLFPAEKIEQRHLQQMMIDLGGPHDLDATTSDVCIITEDDKEFPVHKKVLTARSPVFSTMFKAGLTEQEHGVVNIADVSSTTMKIFLEYMYTGKILTDELREGSQVVDLAYAAEKYQMKLLSEACGDMLTEKCNKSNALDLLKAAEKFNLTKAQEEITKYIGFYWNLETDADLKLTGVDKSDE